MRTVPDGSASHGGSPAGAVPGSSASHGGFPVDAAPARAGAVPGSSASHGGSSAGAAPARAGAVPRMNGPCDSGPAVKLAVFDFDGTSISGNSPVILVKYLMRHRMLKPSVVLRIMLWAAAYKFRLPQSESWVRGLVFTAFCGKPKDRVDQALGDFYDKEIDRLFRPSAEQAMRMHADEGCDVVVISATFEPIVRRAMQRHPFRHQIATQMAVDGQGNYTCRVDGNPIEGAEKLVAVQDYADRTYGEGGWELAYAYGDHHSDRTLLSAACRAFAVTPDQPLERTARREGWQILDWG